MSKLLYEPIRRAVIPAAGLGTRLKPLTDITPKEMLPLGSKPVVQYIIEELQSVGVNDVTFVISPSKLSIRDYFGDSACNGTVRLRYVIQEEPRGLADAILKAETAVEGARFIVALGDTVIISDYEYGPLERLLRVWQDQDAWAGISVGRVATEKAHMYGIVRPSEESCEWGFEIDGAVEKPQVGEIPSNYAIGGRYVFDSDIFDLIRRTKTGAGGEQQITDSIVLGISEGRSVWCAPLTQDELRHDIGSLEVYCEAFTAICLRDKNLAPAVMRASQQASASLQSVRGGSIRRHPVSPAQ